MIKVNGDEINVIRFPDNSIKFEIEKSPSMYKNEITWDFESMEELIIIIGLVDKLSSSLVDLHIPYMPTSFIDDGVVNYSEGVMIKYLVETLDNLKFNKVIVPNSHLDSCKKWAKKAEWVEDDKLVE